MGELFTKTFDLLSRMNEPVTATVGQRTVREGPAFETFLRAARGENPAVGGRSAGGIITQGVCEFLAAPDVELAVGVPEVRLNGLLRDEESAGVSPHRGCAEGR